MTLETSVYGIIKADCLTCDLYHDFDRSIVRLGKRMREHQEKHPGHKIFYTEGHMRELEAKPCEK